MPTQPAPPPADASGPAGSPFAAAPLPDLAKALALLDHLHPNERLVVLLADQRSRWRGGQPAPVESYGTAYPALAEDRLVDLAFQELCLRAERGEGPPDWASWQERFRTCVDPLKWVWALLAGGDLAPPPAPPDTVGPDPAPNAPLPTIARYEVMREVGRGGMGVVYEALQARPRRRVAIKMMRRRWAPGSEERLRFDREAETVAQLQHPNIVQIYEVGEANGRPYFAMELVDGGTLADQLDGSPIPALAAAEKIEALATAVEYAHRRRVVHRDLKPANVLMTRDGQPKIGDFGLAKPLDPDPATAVTGGVAGTPSYMAPEQAEGRHDAVGPPADIYALGAILYELLTGRPPFAASNVSNTIQQVRRFALIAPRRINPEVPRQLEAVCLRCLRKDPAQRYPSAAELARDLARFRAGEPLGGDPGSRLGRAWRGANAVMGRHNYLGWLALIVTLVGSMGLICRPEWKWYFWALPVAAASLVPWVRWRRRPARAALAAAGFSALATGLWSAGAGGREALATGLIAGAGVWLIGRAAAWRERCPWHAHVLTGTWWGFVWAYLGCGLGHLLDDINRKATGRPDLFVPVAGYYVLVIAVTVYGAWNSSRLARQRLERERAGGPWHAPRPEGPGQRAA